MKKYVVCLEDWFGNVSYVKKMNEETKTVEVGSLKDAMLFNDSNKSKGSRWTCNTTIPNTNSHANRALSVDNLPQTSTEIHDVVWDLFPNCNYQFNMVDALHKKEETRMILKDLLKNTNELDDVNTFREMAVRVAEKIGEKYGFKKDDE